MHDHLRTAPIGVVETTADGTVEAVNDVASALLETDRPTGDPIDDVFPRSAAGSLRSAFAGERPDERSFEEYYPPIDRWFAVDVVRTETGGLVYVRDRSGAHERRQRVERLERRLDRMESIDELVGTVLRQVIEASGREEVSSTVCERLGTTDLYEFAWLGERDLADGDLQVVAAAGEAPDVRERIVDHLGSDAGLPEQTAVAAERTHVVQTIAEADDIPRPVRRAAFGRGLQSSIAVPLAYRDTVYGVLGVYAAREDGFSDQERASLETLGAIAGFAINAIRQEELLFAETVTELTLDVRDEDLPLTAVADDEESVVLSGAIPRDDDTTVCYVRAAGGTDAVETLTDHERVLGARLVSEEDDLLEVEVTGETPVARLSGQGATVSSAEYDPGGARIVAEVPSDVELRRLVGSVDAVVSETDVVSKADRRREAESVDAFRSALEESLTDRQRTVLRTAYLSDYFTSPRGSSSAEVAEALDVTGPTILYHLRRGQRKLLEAFFETDPETPTDRDS
jgi:predicted DNA binding protein/putative methionine-R-sulfoxide reductase with GAF domain